MKTNQDIIRISGLEAKCIIGVYDWERETKQKLFIDIEVPCDAALAARHDRIRDAVDYERIAESVRKFARESKFELIETLAERIAALILAEEDAEWVKIKVFKPGAIRRSKTVSIQIERWRKD